MPSAIDCSQHPLSRRNYRVGTFAIEQFLDVVERCLRVLIPGALVYARPRMGKTNAIEYIRIHLKRARPSVLTFKLSCEHHRVDFEGPFFSALLSAAGAPPASIRGSLSDKRRALILLIHERLKEEGGNVVALFCDEAQRLSRDSYEWLRDAHDQLADHGVRLITFLVGQPQLLGIKAKYQLDGEEQIVARFMIEQLLFRGIAEPGDAATCLAGYDGTRYPEDRGPTFTEFFLPRAYGAGLRLEASAASLWNAFVRAHAAAQLSGKPEIQMDYFTRAVEAMLIDGAHFDHVGLELDEAHWARAVQQSGYVAAQKSVSLQSP